MGDEFVHSYGLVAHKERHEHYSSKRKIFEDRC